MEYIFVRHGITENLEGNRIQGWSPAPLSSRGRLQAQAAADRLKAEHGITGLFSSPVHRTLETAQIISATLELPVQELACLAERRMPSRYWGVPRSEIAEYLAAAAEHVRDPDWAWDDDDTLRTIVERARAVVRFLLEHAAQPGKIVLVSHGTIMRHIMATLLLPENSPISAWAEVHASMLGPQPCAFAEVAPGPAQLAMRAWNDWTHLRGLLDYDTDPGA
jgi:probable phosphoglycerate mutase